MVNTILNLNQMLSLCIVYKSLKWHLGSSELLIPNKKSRFCYFKALQILKFFESHKTWPDVVFVPFLYIRHDGRKQYPPPPQRRLSYHLFIDALLLFVYHRCWNLSAGNFKWIYQMPIVVAVVVSTCWFQLSPTVCEMTVFRCTCGITADG